MPGAAIGRDKMPDCRRLRERRGRRPLRAGTTRPEDLRHPGGAGSPAARDPVISAGSIIGVRSSRSACLTAVIAGGTSVAVDAGMDTWHTRSPLHAIVITLLIGSVSVPAVRPM